MTYRIVPCPKCNRLHGVVAVSRVRASRTRLDDSAASWGTARDRVESGVPERHHGSVAASPEVVMPPIRSRQPEAPSPAGG